MDKCVSDLPDSSVCRLLTHVQVVAIDTSAWLFPLAKCSSLSICMKLPSQVKGSVYCGRHSVSVRRHPRIRPEAAPPSGTQPLSSTWTVRVPTNGCARRASLAGALLDAKRLS